MQAYINNIYTILLINRATVAAGISNQMEIRWSQRQIPESSQFKSVFIYTEPTHDNSRLMTLT